MSNIQELGHQSPHAGASAISNQSIVNKWALPDDPPKGIDALMEAAIEQGKQCDALTKRVAELQTKVQEAEEQVQEEEEAQRKSLAKAEALDRASRRFQTKCALALTHMVALKVELTTASDNSVPRDTRDSGNSHSRRSHHGRSRTLHGKRGSDYDAQ